jgi:hypothetical protein
MVWVLLPGYSVEWVLFPRKSCNWRVFTLLSRTWNPEWAVDPNWTQPQRVGETCGWSTISLPDSTCKALGKCCNHVKASPKKIAGKEMFEAPKIINKSNMTDYTRFRLLSRNGGCQLPSIVLALPSLTSPTSSNKCGKTWQNQQTWIFFPPLLHRMFLQKNQIYIWRHVCLIQVASSVRSFRFRGHPVGIANGTCILAFFGSWWIWRLPHGQTSLTILKQWGTMRNQHPSTSFNSMAHLVQLTKA